MKPLHSPLFSLGARLLFYPLNGVALYLLIRGHEQVGGGFIAALVTTISLLLLAVSGEKQVNLHPFTLLGMLLVLGSYSVKHSALIFDIGIYCVVFSFATTVVQLFRWRLLHTSFGGKR
jgi:multisubunit Na+/H+ antiporter MnhB subunit